MKNWLLALLLLAQPVFAQMVEVKDEEPKTGKEKAQDYFKSRQAERKATGRAPAQDSGAMPRYLAVHVGTFFSSQAYKWGDYDQDDRAKFNAGVTYRVGEWINSMDANIRMEFTNYDFEEGDANKLSFGGLITFPDANSRFPLYFGAGLGLGVFMKNINKESALALDYSLVAGARFLDVIENVGFMVETGLKNHFHLLSDGQFNGVFINVGTVFAF